MPPPFLAAFAGTAVEYFETVVIAYAVLRAGYPREAIGAVAFGHAAVFALAALLLPWQAGLALDWLRLPAALLLTATGLYWTQKSLRRLWSGRRPRWAEDPLGKIALEPAAARVRFSPWVFLVMAKSAAIEAGEILVLVLPLAAATHAWPQIALGVAAAMVTVTLAAWLLHGRLRQIPEVKLKLGAGLVLTALGLSWLFEAAPA